jgi:hypothetical protein
MEATVLLQGHARIGAWMAIDVHLKNDGPPISGELRLTGGTQGRTRFGTQVEAPTQSDQMHRLYVQPPGFGREVEVSLVDGATTIATTKATYTVHDGTQMIVGIVAESPGDIIGDLDLLPNVNNVKPLTMGLQPADLPDRVEAWGSLDRLVWQDVDSNLLTPEQITALRGWVAGGGRLIITGGTAGPSSLSAFPDALLPYRPTATTDIAPSSLVALLGEVPTDASDLPALSGKLAAGRALATVGGQTGGGRTGVWRWRGDADRVRPDRQVAERHERGRRPLASADPDAVGGHVREAATTARSSRRQRSSPTSLFRLSAASSHSWSSTSC